MSKCEDGSWFGLKVFKSCHLYGKVSLTGTIFLKKSHTLLELELNQEHRKSFVQEEKLTIPFKIIHLMHSLLFMFNNFFFQTLRELFSPYLYKQVSRHNSKIKLAKMPQNMKSSDRFRTISDSAALCQLIPSPYNIGLSVTM